MPELLAIKAYRNETATLAELTGALKLQNCTAVKACLIALLESAGAHPFYLHVGQLTELDSAGLGVLVSLHMASRKLNVEMHLLAPTAFQMKLLTATRLVSVLSIHDGIQAEIIWQRLTRPEFAIPLPTV